MGEKGRNLTNWTKSHHGRRSYPVQGPPLVQVQGVRSHARAARGGTEVGGPGTEGPVDPQRGLALRQGTRLPGLLDKVEDASLQGRRGRHLPRRRQRGHLHLLGEGVVQEARRARAARRTLRNSRTSDSASTSYSS